MVSGPSKFNRKERNFLLGNRAAGDFRNAADEAKNRSGYGTSGSRSSSPQSSSGYSSGETATDKIKEKASEFAQQAKSSVWSFDFRQHRIVDRYFY